MRKTKPNSAKNADVTATLAALKRRLRKMPTGSIGDGVRSSHHTNVASRTAARAKPPIVVGSAQPHSGASMIVNTRVVMAAMERKTPGRSSRGASCSRDSGMRRHAATATMIVIGTLMKKTDPHQ